MSYDLNMLASTKEPVTSPMVFDNTRLEGAAKTAQQCLVLLLKDQDSALTDEFGTDLGDLLEGGNIPNQGELRNKLSLAAAKVFTLVEEQQSADLDIPSSERLIKLDATLNASSDDSLVVGVVVTTEAGSTTASATV